MVVTVGRKTTGRSCVRIPAGKSVSHRVLIAASLADGVSRIENLSNCEDVNATIRCLGKAGTTIIRKDEGTEVRGAVPAKCRKDLVLDAGESGSTLRFLIPVLSSDARKTIWTGGGRLMERPLAVYEDIYRRQDCLFEKEGKNLTVKGKLKPGVYTVPGDVS
ncbi:MAG: 3-phosphoshikimate 1-carboxyvinyltransferase, partial [Erysipelotrichales bacterium]|nr:3-phosphoshikimate 1-carboxyvinyltransferase [Erysipelotrichales bacterium]